MKLFWLLYALAAAIPLLGRMIRKGELLLSFLCVALTCAASALAVLCAAPLRQPVCGVAAVLLMVLAGWERSGKE